MQGQGTVKDARQMAEDLKDGLSEFCKTHPGLQFDVSLGFGFAQPKTLGVSELASTLEAFRAALAKFPEEEVLGIQLNVNIHPSEQAALEKFMDDREQRRNELHQNAALGKKIVR